MGRTLEDWFAELDRLTQARDGERTYWMLVRERIRPVPPTAEEVRAGVPSASSAYRVTITGNVEFAHAPTVQQAVETACRELVAGARRILDSAER